jgi:hypothetical protein
MFDSIHSHCHDDVIIFHFNSYYFQEFSLMRGIARAVIWSCSFPPKTGPGPGSVLGRASRTNIHEKLNSEKLNKKGCNWTTEEEQILFMDNYPQIGTSWSKYSGLLPDQTNTEFWLRAAQIIVGHVPDGTIGVIVPK